MSYQVRIVDRAEREIRIDAATCSAEKREDFDFFRDQTTSLPVVRLPIDLPVYRMENFRTYSEQAEYLVREAVEGDYFRGGQERESVQQVQHEILAKLAAKGKANSVVPVIEVLEREGQRERLLITARGVVVNGNRRLAAMRELFARDPQAFQQFSHVNCIVLPLDATAEDVLEIEAILQARPETRLDYDWIGDAQLLAAMLKVKGTTEAVAKRLGRKISEVRNALQALAEADMYLKDWAQAEGEYRRVAEDGEQFFKDMPSLLSGKTPQLEEASRAIAWALFDNRGKLEGRVYNYNVAIGKRAEDVLERLSEEIGVPIPEEHSADASEAEEDDFDIAIGAESADGEYRELVNALRDEARRDESVEALIEICTGIVESEKDKRSGSAALKAIAGANAKLAEVDLSRADPDTHDAIQKQLIAIATRTGRLQAALAQIMTGVADASGAHS